MEGKKEIEGRLDWTTLLKTASDHEKGYQELTVLVSHEVYSCLIEDVNPGFDLITDRSILKAGLLGQFFGMQIRTEPEAGLLSLIKADEAWLVPAGNAKSLLDSLTRTEFLRQIEELGTDVVGFTVFNSPDTRP